MTSTSPSSRPRIKFSRYLPTVSRAPVASFHLLDDRLPELWRFEIHQKDDGDRENEHAS